MANRLVQINPALVLGLAIAALFLGSAAMLLLHAETWGLSPADGAALRFTLLQAALSALIAAVLAVPLARALHRRRFAGRLLLTRLLAAPFVLPVVVAVLGIVTVFGRSGPLNAGLAALGLPPVSIFGLHGVVLANVFFNLPLATRMLLHGWQTIPAERFRLAASLSMPHSAQFRHLELPMLRAQIPGIVTTIFLICLGSFAIALSLGGGPKASTLELSIYQALRFDYDLGRAALLALIQFALCAAVVVMAARLTLRPGFGAGQDRVNVVPAPCGVRRGFDVLVIVAAVLFLGAPVLAVIVKGVPGLATPPPGLWAATLRSLLVALASALLASVAALTLAQAAARKPALWVDIAAMLPLSASGLVLGTGLFLMLHRWVTPAHLSLPVTMLVNAVLTMPYLYRLLLPEARQVQTDYGRLARSLGMSGYDALRHVILPRLARPLGYGAGLAAALSMGDLGVIALFADGDWATLPLLVQHLIGAYRIEQAATAALLLSVFSFGLFWMFDQLGDRLADT